MKVTLATRLNYTTVSKGSPTTWCLDRNCAACCVLEFFIIDNADKDMNKGLMANTHLSPLACVWASLQVLVGDVASGLRSVLYWSLDSYLVIQVSTIVSCCVVASHSRHFSLMFCFCYLDLPRIASFSACI